MKNTKAVIVCGGDHKWGHLAVEVAFRLEQEKIAEFLSRHYIGRQSGHSFADKVLVLDGCGYHCTKSAMRDAGFSGFEHLALADLDFLNSSVYAWSEEDVQRILAICREKLG